MHVKQLYSINYNINNYLPHEEIEYCHWLRSHFNVWRLSLSLSFMEVLCFFLNKIIKKFFNMYPSVVLFVLYFCLFLSTCCSSLFIFSFCVLSHQFAEFLLKVWLETLCCLYQLQYLVLPYATCFHSLLSFLLNYSLLFLS